jgi:hypothetical protein
VTATVESANRNGPGPKGTLRVASDSARDVAAMSSGRNRVGKATVDPGTVARPGAR